MSLSQRTKDLILGLFGGQPDCQTEVVNGLNGGLGAVSTINSLSPSNGNINIVAGSNITVTPAGSSITIASTGGGGVSSLNSLVGALSLVAGSGITVTPAGSNITIAASGSSGANTALSNLTTTSINADLIANAPHSINIGSPSVPYATVNTSVLTVIDSGGSGGSLTIFPDSAPNGPTVMSIQTPQSSVYGPALFSASNAGGATKDVIIGSGNALTNSGNVILVPGIAGGTLGKIKLNDQSGTITAGQVWTATASDGSGHYAAASGGSGMTKIQTQTTTNGQSNVTFSSIPNTYQHLMVIFQAMSTQATAQVGMTMTFNNDTGANYSYCETTGDGSTVSTNNTAGANSIVISGVNGNNPATGSATAGQINIPQYRTNTFFTQVTCVSSIYGAKTDQFAGEWLLTNSPINRIDFSLTSGNFGTGSCFSLYGLA